MSSSPDTLQFCFPTHGDYILCKMNALRKEHHLCDITLLLGGPQCSTVQPFHFHGHRVVLAASSDFLRDQFLLHEGRAKLSVGVVSSVEVGKRLLLSCYTGLLEVPLRELVSYLTAASALQMSQVVEKCAQAVSKYLSPTLAFLKLERNSEEKEIQKPGNLKNLDERDTAQPSTCIQEASSRERGVVVIQSKLGASQDSKVDGQGLKEAKDDERVNIELSEDEEIQIVHTNKSSDQDHHMAGSLKCNLHPPTDVQYEDLVDSSQDQDEDAGEEQKEGEEMFLLAAELQECGELMESNLLCRSGAPLSKTHCSADEQTEHSDSILIQRPYLCRRCDRVFQHLESYVGHLKEHRQYLCLVCGKGFSQKSNLTRHIRVHTGVKPFRCPLCHKTFSQKAMLQDHFNLHTGDKPHKCNYCAVHFAHKPSLRRHLKDIHGKSSLQNVLEEAVDS
ncbi:zinc finger and BTB domain-containing protein 26-like [Dicentrarchus labrax]|uniref:Zinc finger and BTB domain-containing protein 6 n=1 Tax=Dicentrarchus labrax TaxID=13489 RepID=A0A8C4IFP2_DICLA|nr:zinc finger and BTB domain-containing protein 26-like [Dicentrarchus labrax]XP_051268052.1 zinc finger and BTB domain-containing protein 26-like [Dicentrarchus labrax]XP_051268053.1 zinc finger and BTB domain-containing protein 26-like [Dicentrarchus labrax]